MSGPHFFSALRSIKIEISSSAHVTLSFRGASPAWHLPQSMSPFLSGAGLGRRREKVASPFMLTAKSFFVRGEEERWLSPLSSSLLAQRRWEVRACPFAAALHAQPGPCPRAALSRARAQLLGRVPAAGAALLLTLASLAVPRLAMPRALSSPSHYHF